MSVDESREKDGWSQLPSGRWIRRYPGHRLVGIEYRSGRSATGDGWEDPRPLMGAADAERLQGVLWRPPAAKPTRPVKQTRSPRLVDVPMGRPKTFQKTDSGLKINLSRKRSGGWAR